MTFFNKALTVLSFIFVGRAMFEIAIAFGATLIPGTKVGDSIDMSLFIQSLTQSHILVWLGLFVCVELIRPCLSIFIHHDSQDFQHEPQGWTGMVEYAGGPMRFGLQCVGAVLWIFLLAKWWVLISPSENSKNLNFSKFDWACLIMAPTLMNLVSFLPKKSKNHA